jgi:hypothetical protein
MSDTVQIILNGILILSMLRALLLIKTKEDCWEGAWWMCLAFILGEVLF